MIDYILAFVLRHCEMNEDFLCFEKKAFQMVNERNRYEDSSPYSIKRWLDEKSLTIKTENEMLWVLVLYHKWKEPTCEVLTGYVLDHEKEIIERFKEGK